MISRVPVEQFWELFQEEQWYLPQNCLLVTRPLAAGIEDGTFGLRVESAWLFLVACLLLCFDFLADIDVE